ncbi:hypothetical protein A2963_00355 [Candidatus Roizmanbacteria bacterium RIFCSPLOWO2_01_FULL_40_13]|nr:MAG: hypothetical protein A2963_00355 [Candidatus Roizmanbacteria bacterium RIFCSPLOWO2_01_FULL_40_13]
MTFRRPINPVIEYNDGQWTNKQVITTELVVTMPDGEQIEIIRDGKPVESEAVKPNLLEGVIQVFRNRGVPAAGGGKERRG